jgi:cell division protein FtsB
MEKGVSTARRKKDRFAAWLVLPILPLIVYALLPAHREYRAALAQRDAIESRIARVRQLNKKLAGELYAMNTDPFYVEKVARENYGYRRTGEVFVASRSERARALARKREGPRGKVEMVAQRLKKNKGVIGVAALLIAATWGFQLIPTGSGARK